MNLLLLCNKVPYPPKDGGSIATFNLARGFVLAGHKVSILAMNTPKHYIHPKHIPELILKEINISLVNVNTRIKLIYAVLNLIFSKLPYIAVRYHSGYFKKALSDILEHNSFDIIQIESPYLGYYIPIIKKYSSAKISYRAHNVEHEIWNRIACQSIVFYKKIYLMNLAKRVKKLEINLLNKYDCILPITQRDNKIFISLGNTKPSFVTPVGLDLSNLQPNQPDFTFPTLFYIGSLDWMPNQEGLRWFINEVWEQILIQYPLLEFHIAGRNAPDNLIKLFNKKNITFFGEVDNSIDFINNRSVMIVPLFSGSGMRVKIVEGMALEKTIITTSIGTEGIETKNGENILIADTVEDFINAISITIENKDTCSTIGKNARAFIHQYYDNRKIAEDLIMFYKNLK